MIFMGDLWLTVIVHTYMTDCDKNQKLHTETIAKQSERWNHCQLSVYETSENQCGAGMKTCDKV